MMKSALNNKRSLVVIAVIIFLISLLYRYPQVISPFWTDEFSSASQAKLLLRLGFNTFTQKEHYIEYHNIIPHILISGSFMIFRPSVWAAKIPFVLVGSLFPVVLFFFVKKFFSMRISASSTLLTIFSYWFISWSQQARGYVLQQTALIVFLWTLIEVIQGKQRKWFIACITTTLLGILTHVSFVFSILSAAVFILLFHRKQIVSSMQRNSTLLFLISIVVVLSFIFTGEAQRVVEFLMFFQDRGFINNLWYYHSFLWRTYGLITFLSVLGVFFLWRKKTQMAALFILTIGAYFCFYFFVFPPYVTRYLLSIFPLFFILTAYALDNIAQAISKQAHVPILHLLTFFLIVNGNIFTVKPKLFYSINHNVREIALLDYDAVYQRIKKIVEQSPERVAVIDTWPDRRDWYLDAFPVGTYTFRWEDGGIMKQTPYHKNDSGEKEIDLRPGEKLISSQKDLLTIIQSYPQGFLFIDDTTLPSDVIEYAEKHLKKEIYIDHYQFDDNPYSLWPATLYSWGIKE